MFYEGATSQKNERLKMVLDIPNNTWFSIGFGRSMNKVDMIGWHANGEDSYVRDYFSTGKNTPPEDDEQNLESLVPEFILKDDTNDESWDRVRFVTYRDLETSDTEQDFIVPLDVEIDMVYGILAFSSDWREHNEKGTWSMKVHKGLGNLVVPLELDEKEPKTDADDEGLDTGIIIAIVVGAIVVVALLAVIYICGCKKCDKAGKPSQNSTQTF